MTGKLQYWAGKCSHTCTYTIQTTASLSFKCSAYFIEFTIQSAALSDIMFKDFKLSGNKRIWRVNLLKTNGASYWGIDLSKKKIENIVKLFFGSN